MSPVLVAHLAERSEATAIVRAALAVDIVYVGLAEPPPSGRQTLQLFIDRELVASLSAELVGSGRGGEYPLRVGLLHPEDAAALEALTSGSRAPQARPLPSRSPPPNDEAPLAPARIMGADAEDRTLSSRTSRLRLRLRLRRFLRSNRAASQR